jgi:non-canonical (house-cleaning) NTP pyrophosphatase
MASKNTIPIRADLKFFKEFIRDVQIERIKRGKDPPLKPVRTARLTLALTRLPEAKAIKQRLINADLP